MTQVSDPWPHAIINNGSDSFWGVYQPRIKVLVIYMQLSETPKLGFTWVVNANLLIHGRQKCPKY